MLKVYGRLRGSTGQKEELGETTSKGLRALLRSLSSQGFTSLSTSA